MLRSVLKYGKKQFPVYENKRDTYRFPSAFRYEPSTLSAFEGERKQLMEVRLPFAYIYVCVYSLVLNGKL